MPASVTDAVFSRRDLCQHKSSDDAVAPTGMLSGSGIHKSHQAGGGSVSRLSELAGKAAVDASGLSTMSHAQASRMLRTDRAVRALSIIELCVKRQEHLSAQLAPLPVVAEEYRSLGTRAQRDPDQQAAYNEEQQRLRGIINEARDTLEQFFGVDVGPPLDLKVATVQRKAIREAREGMAQLTT